MIMRWLYRAADPHVVELAAELERLKLSAQFERTARAALTKQILQLEGKHLRLKVALQRIDGINDNPAVFNADIDKVIREALD